MCQSVCAKRTSYVLCPYKHKFVGVGIQGRVGAAQLDVAHILTINSPRTCQMPSLVYVQSLAEPQIQVPSHELWIKLRNQSAPRQPAMSSRGLTSQRLAVGNERPMPINDFLPNLSTRPV